MGKNDDETTETMAAPEAADESVEDGAEPFGETDAEMSGVEIEQYIAEGYEGVAVGESLADATAGTVPLLDQEDLIGQAFAILGVREQDKTVMVNDNPVIDYTYVIVAGQAVNIDANGEVIETGIMFLFIAGRDESVLGREFITLSVGVSPTAPKLIPHGLRRVELGGSQHYYTTRPERDPSVKHDLFPGREIGRAHV